MTEPAETAPDTTTPEGETAPPEKDLASLLAEAQAEAEKWKKNSRKNEERAKSNATAAQELEEQRRKAMTDQERAVAEARDQAMAEVRAEMAGGLVAAEFKAASVAAGLDPDAFADGVDVGKFLTDEGRPDTDAISAFVARFKPAPVEEPKFPTIFGDFGQSSGREAQPLDSDPLMRDLKNKLGVT